MSAADLPAPTRADLQPSERLHLIGPFDLLTVEVFGIGDLSRDVRVDANGRISLPVAGEFTAAGMTPTELSAQIVERLRAGYVRNPQVSVNIKETVSQTVTIEGSVTRPGIYPITGRMTMLRAIARAEGTSEYANARHVVVFRTVNNQQMAALYDLSAIRVGAYEDPEIYPNDVVSVGESAARRIFPQILQAGGLLATPIIAIINRGL